MKAFLLSLGLLMAAGTLAGQSRMRDYGIEYGIFRTGPLNAITDVKGVRVGHVTLIEGDSVRTGVTAVIPHPGNIFRHKLPAAVCIGNGYGKMAGYTQIRELGNIETPIVLTNTLGVAAGLDALIDYTLSNPENGDVKSVNGVVGETNDGTLNDIRGRHVTKEQPKSLPFWRTRRPATARCLTRSRRTSSPRTRPPVSRICIPRRSAVTMA